MLRRSLLERWAGQGVPSDLEHRLQSLDHSDPDGAQGVEARLAIWFAFADPGDGHLVDENDPVLTALSEELRGRLAGMVRQS